MLASLKAAIESKKRALKEGEAAGSGNGLTKKSKDKEEDDVLDEEEKAMRALNEKAKRYRQLETGETNVVPAGALIDFERKLNRSLKHEDERDDDTVSRSMAAVQPPDFEAVNDETSDKREIIRKAVDDILNEVQEPGRL